MDGNTQSEATPARSRGWGSYKPPTLTNLRSTFTFIPQIFIERIICVKYGMAQGARDIQPSSSQAGGESHRQMNAVQCSMCWNDAAQSRNLMLITDVCQVPRLELGAWQVLSNI